MKPPTLRTALFLAVDVALLTVCVLYIPALLGSARAPFDALSVDGHTQVASILDGNAAGTLVPGARISAWNGTPVSAPSDIEYLRSYQSVGDSVAIDIEGGGRVIVRCLPLFNRADIGIILAVGFITWGLGVFVLLSRSEELAAEILHWSLVFMGTSTILTWGHIPAEGVFPFVAKGTFLVSYLGVPSFFLFFTLIFPKPKPGPLWLKSAAAFLPLAILLVILGTTLFHAMQGSSLALFRTFHRWLDIFHVLLILNVVSGLFSIIESYRMAETRGERKKIEWILWGLALGPTPFLFLVVVPELFSRPDVIPEVVSVLFFLLIPVSFAISFVKYHLLDVEVVIKRTTVYAVVLAVVIGLYTLAVGSVSAIVGAFVPQSAVIAAVGVAILFEPVRNRVQHFVDRRFFRVQYDLRQTGRSVLHDIESAVDESHLAKIVVRKMDEVIPVERLALITSGPGGSEPLVLAGKGWETAVTAADTPCRFAGAETGLPAVAERCLEPGVAHVPLPDGIGIRHNIVAVFPLAGENRNVLGCIALGPKRSSARFSAEDVDLLTRVASESGLALRRIRAQRQLLMEQITARRLEELNRMKSDFVSYVSHELRTPLTSIKMFAEILNSRRLRLGRTAREYVKVIEGESERLSRMVTTILDSARMEEGGKEYRLSPGDLRDHVRTALDAMAFQLKQNKFDVRLKQPGKPLRVMADPDAVVQAVVNLIANAIKYSFNTKRLTVELVRRDGAVECTVRDQGEGIPPEAVPHLFEKFYRAPETRSAVQGVGLGLPLVRHIMDAHRGRVEVATEVGKGSTFTLVFPEVPEQVPEAVRTRERHR